MEFLDILDAGPTYQAQVRELRNHADIRRFMYTDHPIGPQEHASWLASLGGNHRQKVFVILHHGAVAGVVSLNGIDTVHRTADWAFYLDPALQGKGLGSRVEFWLLDHAFNEAGLEKLNCEVLASNPTVVKLHRRFGFTQEGVRRQNILKDGERMDVVLLGITRDEWLAQRPALVAVIDRLGSR